MMNATVGDRIISERADGRFDLLMIDSTGMRVRLRSRLRDRKAALEAAQALVRLGGRVWMCTDAAPDKLEPWAG
jgi:hypothetical protein